MPYGFNDDRSKFDLADISQSTEGTFTVNPATSGNYITDASIESWAEGRIGCVSGAFRPMYSYTSAFWLLVGTTDILPASETGGTFAGLYSNTGNALKITPDGEVYIYIINGNANNALQGFSISYVVAE